VPLLELGVKKLKKKEFLTLKQGNMTVSEYLDEFTHLSRYAPDEVNTDAKRQERFLDGLIGPLNYHLQSHTFPNFQMLLNKAIGLENKRKELREQKRKFQSQGQSSSNTRRQPREGLDDELVLKVGCRRCGLLHMQFWNLGQRVRAAKPEIQRLHFCGLQVLPDLWNIWI
jgi:hypothetical protein